MTAYPYLDGPFKDYYSQALTAKKSTVKVVVSENPILAACATLPYQDILGKIVDVMRDTFESDSFCVSRGGALVG